MNFKKSFVKKCEGDLYRCGRLKNEPEVNEDDSQMKIRDVLTTHVIQNAFFKRSTQNNYFVRQTNLSIQEMISKLNE